MQLKKTIAFLRFLTPYVLAVFVTALAGSGTTRPTARSSADDVRIALNVGDTIVIHIHKGSFSQLKMFFVFFSNVDCGG